METMMVVELSWALAAIFGIVNIVLFGVITNLLKRMAHIEAQMVEMKLNYINRFETAKEERKIVEKVILEAINKFKLENAIAHEHLTKA
jgi:hypothetical protein